MPEIQMPKLSDTMTEGTLVAWKKKKGDKVSAGELLAEIETDKATMEWESPEDGTLAEIYVEEGGKVNVGDRIAFIGEEGEEAPKKDEEAKEEEKKAKAEKEEKKPEEAKAKEKEPEKKEAKPKEEKEEEEKPKEAIAAKKEEGAEPKKEKKEKAVEAGLSPAQATSASGRPPQPEEARVKASPVARRVAVELGVDLSGVKGTGPEGRVTETDVRAAAKSVGAVVGRGRVKGEPKPAPSIQAGEVARIQLSGMRRIIAQRMAESLGPVPHFYLTIDIDAGPLMAAREELKAAGEESDTSKITVNDFVLKAAVMAAVKVPRVNASFDSDAFVQYADVDLGIAVAIEDGLLTPVIRAAQSKSLREISAMAKDLAHRARNKRMKPEEFQGGTFTVSNLGGMGIDSFSAVINPPQGFILAVGKVEKVPVIDDCDQIVVGHRMSITMSCDHRVIDGALGAEYLKELRHLLENPALLLV
jgi:pyruvate dehydrogenase E2 component (dihydrolipoamide acetyltransferase)